MAIQDYLVPAFSVTMILAVIGWLVYLAYWLLKKLGVWEWFAMRKINKKLKNYEFEDKIINDCLPIALGFWDYYDIKRFAKHKPKDERDKIMFTTQMLKETSREELLILYERGYNRKYGITGQNEKFGSTKEKNGTDNGGEKVEYYRGGKTSHYFN